MPALPPVPKVLKNIINFAVGPDVSALTRFFLQYGGTAPTAAQLVTMAGALASAWGTNMSPMSSPGVAQNGVSIEDLSSATGAFGSDSSVHVGTRTGGILPAGSCLEIGWNIARRYRGGKPKQFLPCGTATDLNAVQQWTSTFISAITSAWTNFETAVLGAAWASGGPLSFVNVSYYQGFTVVTNPITHRARNVPTLRGTPVVDPIASFFVELSVASQRRRNVI